MHILSVCNLLYEHTEMSIVQLKVGSRFMKYPGRWEGENEDWQFVFIN